MPVALPDPSELHPVVLPDGSRHAGTVFLKNAVDHPRMEIGDYTYANAFQPPKDWASTLAPYLYPMSAERLIIGRYCQIAAGVTFVTASANHAMDGVSTYPFPIFDCDKSQPYLPDTRDTVIGHDVWLGYGAMVCPGAHIGNGVIVGAGAVVRGHIPDFSVVTGNPAQVARARFDAATMAALQRLAWWHWPVAAVIAARSAIMSGDIAMLESIGAEFRLANP